MPNHSTDDLKLSFRKCIYSAVKKSSFRRVENLVDDCPELTPPLLWLPALGHLFPAAGHARHAASGYCLFCGA